MKILSINNSADIYGASRCLVRLYSRFARDGHEVHVVLPEHGPLEAMLLAEGITVHLDRGLSILDRAALRSLPGVLRFALGLPLSALRLARLIRRLKIDIVHSNTAVLPSPALAAWVTGRRHVWHLREFFSEFRGLWKPFQRYMIGFSDAVIAISTCTRDQFDPRFRAKVKVIYDGLDPAENKLLAPGRIAADFRANFSGALLLVGVIGRIKWLRKGQEVLVRAAALVRERRPGVHYVVVGSAAAGNENHVTRLEALIRECGMTDRITLAGEVAEPEHLYQAFDLTVVPSIQAEPFGCVVTESMAQGVPVIGSRSGGIAEQIVDGQTGLLFAPGDERALAAALDKLLADPALRRRMGEESSMRVQTHFHMDATYAKTLQLFRDLCGSGVHGCAGSVSRLHEKAQL